MFLITQNLEKSLLQTKILLSKSDDELSIENYDTNNDSLLHTKHISNSTGSLNTPKLRSYKSKRKAILMKFVNIKEEQVNDVYHDWDINKSDKGSSIDESINSMSSNTNISLQDFNNKELARDNNIAINTVRLSRQLSEPPHIYSSQTTLNEISQNELFKQSSEPTFSVSGAIEENASIVKCSNDNKKMVEYSKVESYTDDACVHISPIVKNRFWNVYVTHTSTPSNLLRKSLVTNDYVLTPITNNDKSMSPITQSATKMTKAMQVCIYDVISNIIIIILFVYNFIIVYKLFTFRYTFYIIFYITYIS